jgi:hypothetical protein
LTALSALCFPTWHQVALPIAFGLNARLPPALAALCLEYLVDELVPELQSCLKIAREILGTIAKQGGPVMTGIAFVPPAMTAWEDGLPMTKSVARLWLHHRLPHCRATAYRSHFSASGADVSSSTGIADVLIGTDPTPHRILVKYTANGDVSEHLRLRILSHDLDAETTAFLHPAHV